MDENAISGNLQNEMVRVSCILFKGSKKWISFPFSFWLWRRVGLFRDKLTIAFEILVKIFLVMIVKAQLLFYEDVLDMNMVNNKRIMYLITVIFNVGKHIPIWSTWLACWLKRSTKLGWENLHPN
jgi:hypothetical protein